MKKTIVKGFTLVEATVAVVLAAMVIGSMQMLFVRYVGISMKGEDTITSVRGAVLVMEDIRHQMMLATSISTPTAQVSNLAEEIDLAKPSHELKIDTSEGTILYEIVKSSKDKLALQRSLLMGKQVLKKRLLSIDRLKDFSVHSVIQRNQTAGTRFPMHSIVVSIELQGSLPGQSATAIKLRTVITPLFNTVENSTWPF